jgi:predicted RNA-binding protein with PUA-like domain
VWLKTLVEVERTPYCDKNGDNYEEESYDSKDSERTPSWSVVTSAFGRVHANEFENEVGDHAEIDNLDIHG